MKSIIFFINALQSGGIENYLLRFLQEKHFNFKEITVFCKSGGGGQLEQQYNALENVIIIKKKISFWNPFDYFELRKYLVKGKFDIICDFTGNFAGLILRIAKSVTIPNRISFYRGASDRFEQSKVKSFYNRYMNGLVYKNATGIFSNSKAALDYFYPDIWLKDNRFKIIYNGVNADVFLKNNGNLRENLNIPENAFVIGHTGRLNSAKNHRTILNVAINLLRKYNDIYFIMCGNGVKTGLECEIVRLKMGARIFVFENRTDIPKFLNTMDCYFFPSTTEGQPNALIEAMVAGIPIVTSNIEPIKEAVPNKIKSFLLSPSNIEGFTELLENIYLNRNLQDEFICKEWARTQYDYKERFDEFFKELNNNN